MPPQIPIYTTCTPWADASTMQPCQFTVPQPLLNNCLQAASDILFQLSGRQWPGICADTVRPEARRTIVDHGRPIRGFAGIGSGYGWSPAAGGGYYGPSGFGACNRSERSSCTAVPEVTLGAYPLDQITQIKIDGAVVDPATYTIHDNRYLVRISPTAALETNAGWPCCNDMTLPDTEVGTWSVSFVYGMEPPGLGKMACAELACQLALALDPAASAGCKLPGRVTQIARQGLTAVVSDPLVFLDKGRTGLPVCDYFLEAVNWHGLRRRSTVSTPDIGRRIRRIG